jgi:hypothetical protein
MFYDIFLKNFKIRFNMKIKLLKSIFVFIVIGLMSGCTLTHKGLDIGELSEYDNLMISNDDIICKGADDDIEIAKGEIYTVGSLSDIPYKAVSTQSSMFGMIPKQIAGYFPSHAIALQGDYRHWAITVNPEGEFLMEERNVLMWIGDNWALMNFKCKTKNNLKPFKKYNKGE